MSSRRCKDNSKKGSQNVALCFPAPLRDLQKTWAKCNSQFKMGVELLKMSLTLYPLPWSKVLGPPLKAGGRISSSRRQSSFS